MNQIASSNNFFIKNGYNCNMTPNYFFDNPSKFIYQPEAYELAYYLASRSDVKYIIDIGGGNGEKLVKFKDKYKILIVDYGENLKTVKINLPESETINFNLENGLPFFSEEILKDSIVIISDVIEHIINPDNLLKHLSEISSKCKFMILTTPDRVRARGIGDFGPPLNPCHVREWSIDEFDCLLRHYGFSTYMIGYTINTNFHVWKNNIIVLSGRLCNYNYNLCNQLNILAVINMYNEVDIIEEVINHLLNQGIDIKVIDNWSDDGSYELVSEISKVQPRVTIERFPERPVKYYEWEKLLQNVEKISRTSNYDWIIHHDADEIRLSPWKDITLSDAISYVDFLGFNAIDFTVLDFRPTDKNVESAYRASFEESLRYFEFGKRPGHFLQIKAWKNNKDLDIDLSSSGGHEVKFSGRRVYPIKFITKHYPLRTPDQAKKKIFMDRINRILPEEKERGWHNQYNHFTQRDQFLWDKDKLINWNPNVFYTDFFIERISGIGVIRVK